MQFGVVGISYKEAGESIRAHTVFRDSEKITWYEQCRTYDINQVVVLSTCNRSECYFLFKEDRQVEAVKQLFQEHCGIDVTRLCYTLLDQQAYQHLFEVCAGYHSMVVGEDQIEGQLQDSYRFACELQACGKQMHTIFQQCFKTIKRIKTAYRISAHPLSIPYIAIQYLKQQSTLDQKRILLIGSGKMAELLLTYLKDEAFAHLYVCHRHVQPSMQSMDERIVYVNFEDRYRILDQCDIILSATSAPHVILKKERYPKTKKQYLIDLAMPRDIDEGIADENHIVVSIDDFERLQVENTKVRDALLKQASVDLTNGVEATMQLVQQEPVQQVLSSLHQFSEEQAEATLALLCRKLQLQHHEKQLVEKILRSSFHRMVKEPMQLLSNVKENQQEVCALVKQLYNLEETK